MLLILTMGIQMSHTPKAYEWYNKNGKRTRFNRLVKEAMRSDVILFGELHDDPIAHWMQLQLAKALYQEDSTALFLGAEMFERDQQVLVDEYLNKTISSRNFEQQARLWPNYSTDYKPILEWAREHKVDFVASNIPRRYASIISRQGPQAMRSSISQEAQKWMYADSLEVDFGLSQYEKMMQMGGGMHGSGMKPENFVYAQAAKDKTMAESILHHLDEDRRCLHFNGSFHSDYFQGIMHYLEKARPGLRIMTISTMLSPNVDEAPEGAEGRADFILSIHAEMTRTH